MPYNHYKLDFTIHPDCPFNKKITKETFEELGFYQYGDQNIYGKVDNHRYIHQLITEVKGQITYKKYTHANVCLLSSVTFKANNQEELKFILNCLDV